MNLHKRTKTPAVILVVAALLAGIAAGCGSAGTNTRDDLSNEEIPDTAADSLSETSSFSSGEASGSDPASGEAGNTGDISSPASVSAQKLSGYPQSPSFVDHIEAAASAGQLVAVVCRGDTTCYVSMHEKDESGIWRQIVSTPGYCGENGLYKTMEGDGKTPVGVFHFTDAFGIADDPGCAIPYKKVTDDDYWSGDYNVAYNTLVDIKDHPELDVSASEHLIDYTITYQYALNISYNEEGAPGAGSAIFLHCIGDVAPFTGGCVSIPREAMYTVMTHVKPGCMIIIDTMDAFGIDDLQNVHAGA